MATRHSAGASRARSHSSHVSPSEKRNEARRHLRLVDRQQKESRRKAQPKTQRNQRKFRVHLSTRRRSRIANLGALTAGVVGATTANITGVGELAVGLFAAYVAYRVIRYGVAPTEAIIEGVQLEHGEVPKLDSNVA